MTSRTKRRLVAIPLALCVGVSAACDRGVNAAGADRESGPVVEPAVVREAFHTERDTLANIDSPAVWHGDDGQHWLLSTAKEADLVRVEDAATGRFVRDVGGPGVAPGRFERPNGIVVLDDIMWIVERDNRRVQLLSLPEFKPIGDFGASELLMPYGLSVYESGDGVYHAYVTDNYELADGAVPPDSALGRRVRVYEVTIDMQRAVAAHVRAFGDTSGPGVLRVVESIAVDPAHDRVLIAEEIEGASMIKVYDRSGAYTGQTIDARYFPSQAEGIALFACADGSGYWITTDQADSMSTFHVFDRVTLEHRGSFRGTETHNTDGIALTQQSFGEFSAGALYAIHDDGNVAAFSWQAVAQALGIRTHCDGGAQ
jgi:3-phytase